MTLSAGFRNLTSSARDDALASAAAHEWEAALHAARAALEASDMQDDAPLLRVLAQAAGELGYYGEAIAANERMRALTPEDAHAARMDLLLEQRLLRAQGQWHEILRDYEAEGPAALDDWDTMINRYVPYWELERFSEALALLRAITASPRATVAHWLLRARLVRLVLPGAPGEAELRECVKAACQRAADDPAVAAIASQLVRPPALEEGLAPWLVERGFTEREMEGGVVVVPPVCLVAAGSFLMGSDPAHDSDAYPDEQPQHAQDLPAYAIGRYPVTVAEYAHFVAQTGRRVPPRWRAQLDRPEMPVTNVTWHDAITYAAWLAERTGEGWRLPTEAEWEKAARFDPATGHSRIYPWGDAFDPTRANTLVTPARMLSGVGAFPAGASPYGALDMAGTTWEWTSSRYQSYPYVAGDGREDGDPVADRVTRGGAWTYLPHLARGACRGHRPPIDYGDGTGFRLVRDGVGGG